MLDDLQLLAAREAIPFQTAQNARWDDIHVLALDENGWRALAVRLSRNKLVPYRFPVRCLFHGVAARALPPLLRAFQRFGGFHAGFQAGIEVNQGVSLYTQ